MTGYGKGYIEEDGRSFKIEIKAVNNRYLDLNIKLPKQISSLEDKIRRHVASRIYRGKIDMYITQDKFSQDDIVVNIDEMMADAYYDALKKIKDRYSIKDEISLSILSRFQDIITIDKREDDGEKIWNVLNKALDESITMLCKMRKEEGSRLSSDIQKRCDLIYNMVASIEKRSDVVVDEYRKKVQERIADFLGEVEVDEAKLINEVAFFADKSNITEEIVRLKSHLIQLKNTIVLDEPVGKKLDFLVQEMNRETNTIGSKSSDLDITNMVVDMKSEIEKIREQIQNIE